MSEKVVLERKNFGRMSAGIKTGMIYPGDDWKSIVIEKTLNAIGSFAPQDVISVTEAVVAIAQQNFVTKEDICKDIARKFPNAETLVIYGPIQSRNRIKTALDAIVATPGIKRVIFAMTIPADEMGNHFISKAEFLAANLDEHEVLTEGDFRRIFGNPCHTCTGQDYLKIFREMVEEYDKEVDFILCANENTLLEESAKMADNALVCLIDQEDRERAKEMLEYFGMETVHDMSEIMNEPIDGSGYSPEYGLYGSNLFNEEKGILKLMPRDCQLEVEELQRRIKSDYGVDVEFAICGDGAYKDPNSKIWEKADPDCCLGCTSGLVGQPKEVKLKNFLGENYEKLSREEMDKKLAEEMEKRRKSDDISAKISLGTTPRPLKDLIASAADLMSGSGDQGTPIVWFRGYIESPK